MKNIIFSIAILLLFQNIYSQNYHPLVEENKTWYVTSAYFGANERTQLFKCEGDTVVNDTLYKAVYRSLEEFPTTWTKVAYLNETEDHQVFLSNYQQGDTVFSPPGLLYDFEAEVGDTLFISPINDFTDEIEIHITYIDSTLIEGDFRKRTWFDCETYFDNYWIEGIGSNSGLLEVGFYCTIVCPELYMGCVKRDETTIYPDGFTGDCYVVGIEENTAKDETFEVFPNPADDFLVLSPKINILSKLKFELYNTLGESVLNCQLNANYQTQINLRDLKKGFYIYQISNEKKIIQKGKISIH